jgi:hypothetical protein
MAWDDVVFGVLTGGLYNLGKTAYKAGKAADQAGDAVEEIADSVGEAVGIMGETFTELADTLSSFITELEDLLVTERATPRSEDDLWDEDLERLNALKEMRAELAAELESLGEITIPGSWSDWQSFDWNKYKQYLSALGRLNVVNSAIREILYQEPGVVPATIYEFKEVLERFNTLEQPRIEAIMDATEDSVEEFTGILTEVKKLFVVTRWKPVAEFSPEVQERLDHLRDAISVYDTLISKNMLLEAQLRAPLVSAHPENIAVPRTVPEALTVPAVPETAPAPIRVRGLEAAAVKETVARQAIPTAVLAPLFTVKGIGAGAAVAAMETAVAQFAAKTRFVAVRPMADRVRSLAGTPEINVYLGNHNTVTGRIRFLERERLRIEKAISRITWIKVEEPGCIPKTLDEVHLAVRRFRTEEQPRIEATMDSVNAALVRFHAEEQPRIETIMDSVNVTVLESKNLLENINESLDKSQGWLDFLSGYRLPILIVCCVAGALGFAIMVALLVVLVKLAILL